MRKFLTLSIVVTALILGVIASQHDASTRIDYAAKFNELKPRAEQGDAKSQVLLGTLYYDGLGVPRDFKEALKWFKLSVQQGDADAQLFLGRMYHRGLGVPQNYHEAHQLYRLSAEQGDADAQYNLGVMYKYGQSVDEDIILAYMWTNLSAAGGSNRGKELRDDLSRGMTTSKLNKGRKLSMECFRKKYRGC